MTGIVFIDWLFQMLEQYEAEAAVIIALFFMCLWAAISEIK